MMTFDNPYNYVRAHGLEVFSVEAFALLSLVLLFLLRSDRSLLSLYVLSAPYTDIVYRLHDIQICDVAAVALCLSRPAAILKRAPIFLPMFLILAFGVSVAVALYQDFFSVLYAVKICLAVFSAMVVADLVRDESVYRRVIGLYRLVVLFSVFVATLQFVLWVMGYPIAGVFHLNGIVRVKGLAHEPATFAVWLALAIPLVFHPMQEGRKFDVKLALAIALGLILTSSATALVVVIAFAVSYVLLVFRFSVFKGFRVALLSSALIALASLAFWGPLSSKVYPKIESYVMEITDSEYAGASGRGGDRLLWDYLKGDEIIGIGAFRSSRLQSSEEVTDLSTYISATNFYITTLVEFGLVVGLIALFLIAYWVLVASRYVGVNNIAWFAGFISWFVAIAGIRVFAFYQPWLNYSLLISSPDRNRLE
ncbi:hypothetical protein LNN35_05290 [Pseudomonas stutzeri]|uniref:hypothetical protein n=1 Tax=Stutzerimonas stutzeri TaxID=316 RepID=UPI001E601544|nr:hypothetical protein [Stutzerimonas stutzeri]MCC8342200.1 hypothetical protein [Stutzerimonas stutzeri]